MKKSSLPNNDLSMKEMLFTRILPILKEQTAYFSLNAIKQALAAAEIKLANDTLRGYMSEAMSAGIVSDAGRGWYSRHTAQASLDPKPVAKILREVKKAFPLLDFCCWSTVQFNPFALHLVAQPTIFLYTESDALNIVADTLKENGWDSWANPGKAEAERYVRPGEKTVVLRPAISKQPVAADHAAPIEKALVDLMVESSKLQIMDPNEVQRIIDAVLQAGIVQLPVIIGYAEIRGVKFESRETTH